MLKLDGSEGEGGGQILRSALALSIVTGRPVHFEKIRAGRPKSGLLRQHLTAVLAAGKICDAEIEGAHLGSQELKFTPGKAQAGDYTFAIGSAGSTSLVLQTVLLPLLLAGSPSSVAFEGGTHNTHAPPFDFVARAFIPLINRMGPHVELKLERHGFYPAGGGRVVANIQPIDRLQPLHLAPRGSTTYRMATALSAALPQDIGDRELAVVTEQLHWPPECVRRWHLPRALGQGNVLLLEISDGETTEVVTGFGERGVRAEVVASMAVQEMREFLESGAAVGQHLADQLLLPMALAGGGSYTTLPLTLHSTTNISTIQKFLDVGIAVTEQDDRSCRVTMG